MQGTRWNVILITFVTRHLLPVVLLLLLSLHGGMEVTGWSAVCHIGDVSVDKKNRQKWDDSQQHFVPVCEPSLFTSLSVFLWSARSC